MQNNSIIVHRINVEQNEKEFMLPITASEISHQLLTLLKRSQENTNETLEIEQTIIYSETGLRIQSDYDHIVYIQKKTKAKSFPPTKYYSCKGKLVGLFSTGNDETKQLIDRSPPEEDQQNPKNRLYPSYQLDQNNTNGVNFFYEMDISYTLKVESGITDQIWGNAASKYLDQKSPQIKKVIIVHGLRNIHGLTQKIINYLHTNHTIQSLEIGSGFFLKELITHNKTYSKMYPEVSRLELNTELEIDPNKSSADLIDYLKLIPFFPHEDLTIGTINNNTDSEIINSAPFIATLNQCIHSMKANKQWYLMEQLHSYLSITELTDSTLLFNFQTQLLLQTNKYKKIAADDMAIIEGYHKTVNKKAVVAMLACYITIVAIAVVITNKNKPREIASIAALTLIFTIATWCCQNICCCAMYSPSNRTPVLKKQGVISKHGGLIKKYLSTKIEEKQKKLINHRIDHWAGIFPKCCCTKGGGESEETPTHFHEGLDIHN